MAAGGRLTEMLSDRSVRMAPVDRATASAMLDEVRYARVLTGYRGTAAGDVDAVLDAIVAMSHLADDHTVLEAEVNPLIVREQGGGAWAVDALVTVTAEDSRAGDD